jgi:hypothetical protein
MWTRFILSHDSSKMIPGNINALCSNGDKLAEAINRAPTELGGRPVGRALR